LTIAAVACLAVRPQHSLPNLTDLARSDLAMALANASAQSLAIISGNRNLAGSANCGSTDGEAAAGCGCRFQTRSFLAGCVTCGRTGGPTDVSVPERCRLRDHISIRSPSWRLLKYTTSHHREPSH